jgi:hypothetical protein
MHEPRKLFWFSVPAVAALFMLIGLLWLVGLPWASNRFGFALPGEGGLPNRITYNGRTYVNPATCARAGWCDNQLLDVQQRHYLCWTGQNLRQANALPMTQVGTVPVLASAPYPLMAPQADIVNKRTPVLIVIPLDTGCYVPYELSGGP